MPELNQLPHLIKLLDDDSAAIREVILKELEAFGPDLEISLTQLDDPVNEEQERILKGLLDQNKRVWLRKAWARWYEIEDDLEKLEEAMSLIALFLGGRRQPIDLRTYLDFLTTEYRKKAVKIDATTLAEFLFHEKAFKGVNSKDYYASQNSNLIYVIENKKGLPISLVLLYIFVGRRLGILIEGCNYPGHFLARTFLRGKAKLVDCFNGGIFIDEEALLKRDERQSSVDLVHAKVDAETVISRVLRNLIRAFQEEGRGDEAALMSSLLEQLGSRRGEVWVSGDS